MSLTRRGSTTPLALLALAALLMAAACINDEGATDGGLLPEPSTTTTEVERPDGPAADMSEELTGGDGMFIADVIPVELDDYGYVQEEVLVAGTATSYRSEGDLPTDGHFELVEDATADYRTRAIVRRPADEADFNGTVVVEWMNVSGGLDANPDWAYAHEELLRGGYAWVGVSVQHIGVEGGPVAVDVGVAGDASGAGLKKLDPQRYGSLSHPGDAFSYDIYTQVARALRSGDSPALGGVEPERLLAVGESQSGFALTTYVNGVHPLTLAFDGYLIHSRGAGAAPLGVAGAGVNIAESITSPPTRVRTDQDVPVLILEAEGDLTTVLGYHAARQDDTEHLRLWEIAGAAHADRSLVGPVADLIDCGGPINDGPHNFVVKAALRALDTWARDGVAPPEAPRIQIVEGTIQRDADGIALGGIRTPTMDVPVEVHSGEPGATDSTICLLLGSTRPLPEERLAELYESEADYLEQYEAAADEAIDAGFVLEEDREALLNAAKPELLDGAG
jgi:hypothetical protein